MLLHVDYCRNECARVFVFVDGMSAHVHVYISIYFFR